MQVPTPPALIAVTSWGAVQEVVVIFRSADIAAPYVGAPDAFPCRSVVLVPARNASVTTFDELEKVLIPFPAAPGFVTE